MKQFFKCTFRLIDQILYWIGVLIVPIILLSASIYVVIIDVWWKGTLLIIMSLILAWRDFKIEGLKHRLRSIKTNYYIVPLDPVNEEINNKIEDYFCREKIRTKKVYINKRINPEVPKHKGPSNTKHKLTGWE